MRKVRSVGISFAVAVAMLSVPGTSLGSGEAIFVKPGSIKTSICKPFPDKDRWYASISFESTEPLPRLRGNMLLRPETVTGSNPVVMTNLTMLGGKQIDWWFREPEKASIVLRTDLDGGSYQRLSVDFQNATCDRPNWELTSSLVEQRRAERRAKIRKSQLRCKRLSSVAAQKKCRREIAKGYAKKPVWNPYPFWD